jgi:hypothetical protein
MSAGGVAALQGQLPAARTQGQAAAIEADICSGCRTRSGRKAAWGAAAPHSCMYCNWKLQECFDKP